MRHRDFPGETAARFAHAIEAALSERGRCVLALSRPTPTEAFEALARAAVDWSAVDIIQVDERAAPDGDRERNLTLIEEALGPAVLTAARIHPMPVTGDLENGARSYAGLLADRLGPIPEIDVVHLGLGPDGHTASLLPGDEVLDVDEQWVATTGEAAGFRRMTLTYPVLNAARRVIFVVSGRNKGGALRRLLSKDPSIPAARVSGPVVEFAIDDATVQ